MRSAGREVDDAAGGERAGCSAVIKAARCGAGHNTGGSEPGSIWHQTEPRNSPGFWWASELLLHEILEESYLLWLLNARPRHTSSAHSVYHKHMSTVLCIMYCARSSHIH